MHNERTHPWELTYNVANSRSDLLVHLELAHMHRGEVFGVEKEKSEVTGLSASRGPDPGSVGLVLNP